MTIDEKGMAHTADRKLEIARAIHDIGVDEYGLPPEALIFDVLTFTDHDRPGGAGADAAIETLEGIRLVKRELRAC